MPHIAILYAGLLGILSLYLSFLCGTLRGKTGIPIGDQGNKALLLAMRRHANFAEHVPLALLLILFLELNKAPAIAIHCMGAGLVICRIAHAVGIKSDTTRGAGRFIGAAGTALITLIASIWCVITAF